MGVEPITFCVSSRRSTDHSATYHWFLVAELQLLSIRKCEDSRVCKYYQSTGALSLLAVFAFVTGFAELRRSGEWRRIDMETLTRKKRKRRRIQNSRALEGPLKKSKGRPASQDCAGPQLTTVRLQPPALGALPRRPECRPLSPRRAPRRASPPPHTTLRLVAAVAPVACSWAGVVGSAVGMPQPRALNSV